MKLILKNGNVETEIREITGIDKTSDLLVIRLNSLFRENDIEKFEKCLSQKLGKKVVILDPRFGEVFAIK